MDTNLVTAILTAKAQSNNTMQIVVMIICALTPTLAAIAAWLQSKASNVKSDEVKALVNGRETGMFDELKKLREEVTRLSQEKSKLEERQHGHEIKEALLMPSPLTATTEVQNEILARLKALEQSGQAGS